MAQSEQRDKKNVDLRRGFLTDCRSTQLKKRKINATKSNHHNYMHWNSCR